MKLILIIIQFMFFLSYSFAAEFEVTLTGKYEYPYLKEYEKGKILCFIRMMANLQQILLCLENK